MAYDPRNQLRYYRRTVDNEGAAGFANFMGGIMNSWKAGISPRNNAPMATPLAVARAGSMKPQAMKSGLADYFRGVVPDDAAKE